MQETWNMCPHHSRRTTLSSPPPPPPFPPADAAASSVLVILHTIPSAPHASRGQRLHPGPRAARVAPSSSSSPLLRGELSCIVPVSS
jgi:hypothetical protein